MKNKCRALCVFGTRPEAIKMAPVVNALNRSPRFITKVCVTGQHREMLDQVLTLFAIKPDFDFSLMRHAQGLTDITCQVLTKMQELFDKWCPDWVLVHGDTTTTFAAAMAAFYHKIPVGHVEAGLRTGDIYSPWPEEINRRITSLVTGLHFAPTATARQNLLSEGVDSKDIAITGNSVIDALVSVKEKIACDAILRLELDRQLSYLPDDKHIILVTGHRRENFGPGLRSICQAILQLARCRRDVHIVYPVHPNPNVSGLVYDMLADNPAISLIPPLDYLPFVYLMMRAHIILTDSGGVQEEAPTLGKPVLVLRDTSERPEAIEAGTVIMVGTSTKKILSVTQSLLTDSRAYSRMSVLHNPYGDGHAAERIVSVLGKRV